MTHRDLTLEEKGNFQALFDDNISHNTIMKKYFENKIYTLIFPTIIGSLLALTFYTYRSLSYVLFAFILGICSIQINFIFAHMWAHSLMLEYDAWNIKNMSKIFGQIPSVLFYAFYHHHHHTKMDDWMPLQAFDTAFSHWESFSLFAQTYPFGTITKMYIGLNLLYNYVAMAPFILGYEIGVILLPLSHDWVHEKKSKKFYIHWLLAPLELIGIFATKEDHIRHHNYNHRTIYQGFTSSGLYSARFDAILDKFWDFIYDQTSHTKYQMCNWLWYVYVIVLCLTLSIPTLLLTMISTINYYL